MKEDEALAHDLRKAVHDSTLSVKADVLGLLDKILPVVGPAATAVRETEKRVNAFFQTELGARKHVIDTLWEERKAIETALGRGGRGLSRFIFFDFRKHRDGEAAPEDAPAPLGGEEPKTPRSFEEIPSFRAILREITRLRVDEAAKRRGHFSLCVDKGAQGVDCVCSPTDKAA